jgi:hypothetical protein
MHARVTLSWQRLIAVASGTFGAAITVATGAQAVVAGSVRVHTLLELIPLVCGCIFLFLAFPLYSGREWARRALITTTYCLLVAILIYLFSVEFLPLRSSFARVHPGLHLVIGVCALVAALLPPAFLLAVLHHADVRRAFQPTDASNQTLQPTAGRLENYKGETRK